MIEKPKNHGKFEAAEELLATPKSMEELQEFRELMLEHIHRFEENPQLANSPDVAGLRLLVGAIEARIRLKEFLLARKG